VVTDQLTNSSLDLETSIVLRSLFNGMYLEPWRILSIALAWHLAKAHQLLRWSRWGQPVSDYTKRKLHVWLFGPEPNGISPCSCHGISAASRPCFSRGHTGITAITRTNTVMGCVELWLSMIQMILKSICTTLTIVRKTSRRTRSLGWDYLQTVLLLLSRIGITIFHPRLPRSRKFDGFCGKSRWWSLP